MKYRVYDQLASGAIDTFEIAEGNKFNWRLILLFNPLLF